MNQFFPRIIPAIVKRRVFELVLIERESEAHEGITPTEALRIANGHTEQGNGSVWHVVTARALERPVSQQLIINRRPLEG